MQKEAAMRNRLSLSVGLAGLLMLIAVPCGWPGLNDMQQS
jgi:hypothetical protein